ncbi:hypothetical protein Tmar_2116 [Thermaerobacter marianensis DSM 12885]|uniref:Uncharacterized protein n=1 Tax=Thermaerobacter marianensis (strain ATCC 700841 / DSM 12885 / JCM 10246 / 7p75a) TaxID=644966 RepID=E6SJW4_THEM7|nr:hypothetical protein [Thermaerobacter marianensis]ADU52197.1 hypothetical protein Tmar_2116 [Thermaerobacter marianensis DSM 12885]
MTWEGAPPSPAVPGGTATAARPDRGASLARGPTLNVPPRPDGPGPRRPDAFNRTLRPPRARMLSFTTAGRTGDAGMPAAGDANRPGVPRPRAGTGTGTVTAPPTGVPGQDTAYAAPVQAAAGTAPRTEEVGRMRMEQVKAELERWGELIITLASGRKFELHLGDTEFDLQHRVIRITGPAAHFVLDGDQVEHVEMHFSHPMD